MHRNMWHSLYKARTEIYSKLQTNSFKFSQLNMALFDIWQETAEIHSLCTSSARAEVLFFTFWIHIFPKPKQLWPHRLTPPLIFRFCLHPKTLTEVLLPGVIWLIRIRQQIIHPHTFNISFLTLRAFTSWVTN